MLDLCLGLAICLFARLSGLNLVTLPRNFFSQLFFRGKIQHILRRKHLLALMQDGITGHNLILLCAQNQAHGRIVALSTFEVVEQLWLGEEPSSLSVVSKAIFRSDKTAFWIKAANSSHAV
jgi:hypothetical protein